MKMNWFQFAQFCLLAAQQVIQLVIQAEQALGPKKGEAKKDLVVNGAMTAATVAGGNREQLLAVKTLAENLSDLTVSTMNQSGAFQKSGPETK